MKKEKLSIIADILMDVFQSLNYRDEMSISICISAGIDNSYFTTF